MLTQMAKSDQKFDTNGMMNGKQQRTIWFNER